MKGPLPVASVLLKAGPAVRAEEGGTAAALGDRSFTFATSGDKGVVPGGEVGWGPAGVADGAGGDWVASRGAEGEP